VKRIRGDGQAAAQIVDEIEAKRFKVDFESNPGAPFFRMLQVVASVASSSTPRTASTRTSTTAADIQAVEDRP
jgi:hypothetical protein